MRDAPAVLGASGFRAVAFGLAIVGPLVLYDAGARSHGRPLSP